MSQPAGTTAQQSAPTGGQDRFLIAIVGGTVVLVIAAIVVVFLFGRGRAPLPADLNSPAGVVQSYIEALRAGDIEQARTFLTRQARAQAEARDRQNTYRPSSNDNVRLVVQTVSSTDTSAEVKVTISRFYARSDPFSSGTSHNDVTMRLVREDGTWRISEPTEPYSFF